MLLIITQLFILNKLKLISDHKSRHNQGNRDGKLNDNQGLSKII